MKYQNLNYTLGYPPLYEFEVRSDAGVPLNLTGYEFRFEAFDATGTRIFLETVPSSTQSNKVYFSISDVKGAAFLAGNYSYRLVIVNTLGQTKQIYKGFITVDLPVEQDPPPTTSITSNDITDFDVASVAAVTDFVNTAIAAAVQSAYTTPTGLVAGGVVDNTAAIKVKHDQILALGGGTLTLPAGRYGIKDMDWWHPSVSLICAGRNATVLVILAGALACGIKILPRAYDTSGSYAWNPEFKGFHLTGQKGLQVNTVHGLWFSNPHDDPDADFDVWGEKAYTAGRIVDVEIDNCSGHGINIEPERQRAYLTNVRSTSNTLSGVVIRANDPVIGDRCGFGGNGEHSVKFSACSGAVISGANIWGNPATRSESCVAIHFQNCNSVNMIGNVVNDTISIFGGGTQADRGVVLAGNTLKPHDQLFSSDGVTVDNNDNINCHIRVRGSNNVIIDANVFDSAQTPYGDPPIRFKNLLVVSDSGAARLSATISQEVDSKPWSSASFEPFLVSGDSQLIYSLYETTRSIARSNGTTALGLTSVQDADPAYNLISKKSRMTGDLAMDGPLLYPTPTGSRYVTTLDEGSSYPITTDGVFYIFSGADITAATITLPVAPADGRFISLVFPKDIGTLTVNPGAGASISDNPFPRAVTTNTTFNFLYKASGTGWVLTSSLPGSALTQAQVTAGALGVVGYTAAGQLVMANSVVTIDAKVETILYANLPSPAGLNVNKQYFVSDLKEGVMVKSNGTIWEEVSPPKAKHWIDPKVDYLANNLGAVNTSTTFNQALSAAVTSAIAGVTYGRGKPVIPSPGVYKLSPTPLSSLVSIMALGVSSSVAIHTDHSAIAAPTAQFTLQEDGVDTDGFTSQSEICGIAINGLRYTGPALSHGQTVHGFYGPTAGTSGKLIPALNRVQVGQILNDAVHFDGFDEYRAFQSKFLNNGGYGLWLKNSKNGSSIQSVYGKSLTGQVKLENVTNFNFSHSNAVTPSGSVFTGRWTVELINCYSVKYDSSLIQGPIRVKGTNFDGASTTRFTRRGISFSGVHFQVSEDVKAGYTANHPGNPAYVYDAQIEVEDCSGVQIDNCDFSFGSTYPTAGELAARPAYFVKFTSEGGQTSPELLLKRGSIIVDSVDFVTREMREGLLPVVMPFTKRPYSHDIAVFSNGRRWDEPVLLKKDTVGRGWLLADGTTGLAVTDHPLAYLAGATSRTLDDGVTTFTAPDLSMTVPSDEYGWYYQSF